MKRESAAERALKGQVKRMQYEEGQLEEQIHLIKGQQAIVFKIRNSLEGEIARLAKQRENSK